MNANSRDLGRIATNEVNSWGENRGHHGSDRFQNRPPLAPENWMRRKKKKTRREWLRRCPHGHLCAVTARKRRRRASKSRGRDDTRGGGVSTETREEAATMENCDECEGGNDGARKGRHEALLVVCGCVAARAPLAARPALGCARRPDISR